LETLGSRPNLNKSGENSLVNKNRDLGVDLDFS